MSVGTALLILIVIVLIMWGFRKKSLNRGMTNIPSRQVSSQATQSKEKKDVSNKDVLQTCLAREIEIIKESEKIINKSKNIDTIIKRFATVDTCIKRIKYLDNTYSGMDLKEIITKGEQLIKEGKENFLSKYVTERTNEIINEISSNIANAKKENIAKEGYLLIDKVKKELLNSDNILKLDEISNKIHELSNIPISQSEIDYSTSESSRNRGFTIRGGKAVPTDDAFNAWTSRDLQKMLKAFGKRTNPVDRHYLLMGIVEETYKKRNDPEMRRKCKEIADIHIKEFPAIAPQLKNDIGEVLPGVPTFEKYATVLSEDGEYDKAIEVCNNAIGFDLDDGTKYGYEGRIERIIAKKKEAEKNRTNIRAVSEAESSSANSSVPKRNVKSHRTDQKVIRINEIDISSLAYIPLPRSPSRNTNIIETEISNYGNGEYFKVNGNDWTIESIEDLRMDERPDPAFRKLFPSDNGLIVIDDLGKAKGYGQIEAAALRYDRSGKIAVKAGLEYGVYRIGVHPCGRGIIAMSKDCIVHAYDENLNLLFNTSLVESPEIIAFRNQYDINADNIKNHIRCVAISRDLSRYIFTLVDKAWCIDTKGEGIWGIKLPIQEGWTRISTPSKTFGTSTDVNNALEILGLSLPIIPEDVKRRYRELAMLWHPDINPQDPQAEEKMKSLNSATEILTGIEASTLSNYANVTFEREFDRNEYEANGIKITTSIGIHVNEIQASDWIYAAGFSVKSNSVFLAGYSGRVIVVDEKGNGIRIYDIGSVPRRIVDTGDYLYMLTDSRLYVLRDEALYAVVDMIDEGDLVIAQTGFGLLEKKRLRWFNEDGTYLGNILSKDPIRRVYSTSGKTVIETRQRRAFIKGIPGWWE